jgi:hypothetical protein
MYVNIHQYYQFIIYVLPTQNVQTMPTGTGRRRFHPNNKRIYADPVQIPYLLAQQDDACSAGSSGRYRIVELKPTPTGEYPRW